MTRWQQALGTIFNVRQGEGEPLSLLVLQSFFAGLCFVFFETAANTLFLSTFGVEALPFVYIAMAFVATATGALYARCENFFTPLRLFRATLLFMLGSVLLVTVAYYIAPQRWLFGVLMVWKDVLWMLLGLEFWGFAGALFNVRQGKRLFPVAASGGLVAGLLGGLMVGSLVKIASTGGLLVASAIAAALTVAAAFHLTQRFSQRLALPEDEPAEESGGESLVGMFRRPYLRLLFGITAISLLTYYTLDYVFYAGVEARYPSEAQLAIFFGYFAAVESLANLLTSGLLSGRLITRFGVSFTLCMLPLVVLLGSASASVAASLGLPVVIFFWLLVGTKLLDTVLRDALEEPALRILYQPLPIRERISVQAKRESMIEPIGTGVCGLLLLALTSVLSVDIHYLLFALVALCGLWAVLDARLRAPYTAALTAALSKRRLGKAGPAPSDATSRAIMEERLHSKQAIEAIYCLRLLEDHPRLDEFLLKSVDHPHSEVRLYALEQIGRRDSCEAAAPILHRRLATEKSPRVRGCILRTLCAVAEDDEFDTILSCLHDPHPDVRAGAIVGLLRNGGIDGVVAAGTILNGYVGSPDPADRRFTADVLGEARVSNFYRPLLPLLEDEDLTVRRAAVRAAGKLGNTKLLPPIVSLLADVALREAAATALVEFSEKALPQLQKALRDPDQDGATMKRLMRTVAHIGGRDAETILCDQLDHPVWAVRSAAYEALSLCGYRAQRGGSKRIEDCIRREAERAAWCWAAFGDLAALEGSDVLRKALQGDIRRCEDNLIALLSCLYPSATVMAARRGLRSESSDARAQALEILDSIVESEIKAFLIALLDDLPVSNRLDVINRHFPQSASDAKMRLVQMFHASTPVGLWTRLCSLYLVGQARLRDLKDELTPHLDDRLEMVRETARWSHSRL